MRIWPVRLLFRRPITHIMLVLLSTGVAWAGPYTLLHVFLTNPHPTSGLLVDADGNAYGTTGLGGGQSNAGTVYELSATAGYKAIYAFGGLDGRSPGGALVLDKAGNLYGTTAYGGTFPQCANNLGCGTVFRLSPTNGGGWSETVLYNFTGGADGALPISGLIFDSQGNLYGTTHEGGNDTDCGVVYELTPSGDEQWTQQVLYTFSGSDGCLPITGLTFGTGGDLYGTSAQGGTWNGGTAFDLTASPDGAWVYSVIHEFNPNADDGFRPEGGLILDDSGNLYGTTTAGGEVGSGTVFELTPSGGNWMESVLYSFAGGNDGASPAGSLVFDSAGNLYGATFSGGGPKNYGTLFRLTPAGDGTWNESLFLMGNGPRGVQPSGPLLLDGKGHVFGTAYDGGRTKTGKIGHGVVFRLDIGH